MSTINNKIIQGDCLEVLKTLPSESVDAVITDPPYELGFMGKSWDNTGIANNVDMWKECLRVLKSGGYLLSFGGTRTYHRMACAIEDAGFEVRDMIEWVYGSGFPKSLNIGKAVDKLGGQSLSWFIDYILKVADEKGISRKELTMLFPSKNGNPTGWLWNKQKTQGITLEQYHKIKEFLQLPFADITECEREIVGRGKAGLTAGTIANFAGEKEFDLTKGTSEWEGWGTALKPAHEPICLARKPLSEKTIVENVLKHGTGGINIDGCRIEGANFKELARANKIDKGMFGIGNNNNNRAEQDRIHGKQCAGRFPANLIHDNSEEVRECFPDSKSNGEYKKEGDWENTGDGKIRTWDIGYDKLNKYAGQEGNASRFFKSIIYTAKASKSERNMGCEELEEKERINYGGFHSEKGLITNNRNPENRKPTTNNHPTVKPIALMEYLINMVTREGQTVLDPFAGSGTTLIAAKKLGRKYIGIELEPEYIKIAEARIKSVLER